MTVQIAAIEQANRREQNEFTAQMLELGRVLEQELHPSGSTHASLHAAGSHAHSKSSQLHSTAGASTSATAAGESEDSDAKRSLNKVTQWLHAHTLLMYSFIVVCVVVCCTVKVLPQAAAVAAVHLMQVHCIALCV